MIYSQRFEQEHIVAICGRDVGNRRFLDIGAFNAKVFSNTRALFDLGWGGVCIEPSPGPVRGLVQEYGAAQSRVEVIAAAVGTEPGLMRLNVTDDAVSGNTGALWQEQGGLYGWLTVPVLTIPEILTRFGQFEMVSIDTEGTSTDLLLALLNTAMRPACIVVEHDNKIVEITKASQEAGYSTRYVSEENIVLEFTSRETK